MAIRNDPRASRARSSKPPSDLTLAAYRHIREVFASEPESVKILVKLAILIAIVNFGSTGFSHAQQVTKSKSAPPAAQTAATPQAEAAPANGATTPPGWAARCTSASR